MNWWELNKKTDPTRVCANCIYCDPGFRLFFCVKNSRTVHADHSCESFLQERRPTQKNNYPVDEDFDNE